eukprot:TRINITY_DN75643_c0_g1_i1.p1 TRINITY_DN75643_c0_g1~~TRINITY_DN75643_c0_g1_i1.p1  ORF type:complete len:155 (+),score=20.44 TRINITY_DN75643_c0_g1_i1:61-525(+)
MAASQISQDNQTGITEAEGMRLRVGSYANHRRPTSLSAEQVAREALSENDFVSQLSHSAHQIAEIRNRTETMMLGSPVSSSNLDSPRTGVMVLQDLSPTASGGHAITSPLWNRRIRSRVNSEFSNTSACVPNSPTEAVPASSGLSQLEMPTERK